jgi:hypothetical protein
MVKKYVERSERLFSGLSHDGRRDTGNVERPTCISVTGPSRILGVVDGNRNCQGFDGPSKSLDRGTPGAEFLYGQVELETVAAYAHHGRMRPKEGPLVQAVDRFVTEQIRQLAKQINDRRRHEQDSDELDDIHRENKILDKFKNKFMPTEGFGGNGNRGSNGAGPEVETDSTTPSRGTIPNIPAWRY